MMRQWQEIEKAEVAELLARKFTAGQIARKFAGRSRSAIIGLVNREPMLRSVGFRHAGKGSRIPQAAGD